MARPKKYDDKFIENCADELLEWIKSPDTKSYFLKNFAVEKGFSVQRLSEFAQKNEKFADALKKAKDVQEVRLFDLGLVTKNQAFVIFALKNIANWRDNEKQTDNNDKPITTLRVEYVN